MAVQRIDLNNRAISMEAATADRLIRLGSGDAALLYLYLLRQQGEYDPVRAGSAMGWTRGQLDTALAQLQELGLAAGAVLPQTADPLPQPDQAPDYTAADIAAELRDTGSQFSSLLQEVEHVLGRKLTNTQTSILLELYDHVGLPSEVLLTLVNWLNGRNQKKYGPGKKLSMSYVKRVGYQWKERGYDTLEAADEYIKNFEFKESSEGAILEALGIYGRRAAAGEVRYIRQWLDWGFPPESVAQAYDITVTNTGRMTWSYCNAILRRWHEKNLHTPEEVKAERKPEPAQNQRYARGGQRNQAPQKDQKELERENRQNFLEMQRLLAQMKEDS